MDNIRLLRVLTPMAALSGSAGEECVGRLVPSLDRKRVEDLAAEGVTLEELPNLGASVRGLDLRSAPAPHVLDALQEEMASRGFLVFREQGVLSGDEQVAASELFGGREIHSTHGVHPAAPNQHIFRLSNDQKHGILGVGPQWHNDGSFERAVFSHVGYHIIRVPEKGGDTIFAHQGAAFDFLTPQEQERWQRLVSVNSNSGVLHPLVHAHPISGRPSVYLHLGMSGAVIEVLPHELQPQDRLRLLDADEMRSLFNRYNDLLNSGLEAGFAASFPYEVGDLVVIDNLAIAHKAAPQAHEPASKQGLRILHRSTVKGMKNLDPPFGLPPALNVYGPNPLGPKAGGVWLGGGIGFRWDDDIRMQN